MNHYPITISDTGALDPALKAESDRKRTALIAFAKTPVGVATFGGAALVGAMLGGKNNRALGAVGGVLATVVFGNTLGLIAK